jgi:hypothetical protein
MHLEFRMSDDQFEIKIGVDGTILVLVLQLLGIAAPYLTHWANIWPLG